MSVCWIQFKKQGIKRSVFENIAFEDMRDFFLAGSKNEEREKEIISNRAVHWVPHFIVSLERP